MYLLLPFLSLMLLFAFPAPVPAQSPSQAASPSIVQSEHGEKLRVAGVPNAGKITDRLYRGAQPRDPGLLQLKSLGITTIVDLRAEDQEKLNWEEKKSESLGIHFVYIPVVDWSPPTNEQVAQFLSIFRDSPQEKVFVHCHYGDDRTGIFVAAYRMAYEKLPPDQALKEMYYFGFNGLWHPSMISFIREFPARLASSPALVPFKPKE